MPDSYLLAKQNHPRRLAGLLFVFFFSCGLEDYIYFYPASGVSQTNTTTLDFSHNTDNDSTYFSGYEVYYRLYDGDASAASSRAAQDGSYIEASWDSTSPDTIFARLIAKGYRRVVDISLGNYGSSPLVEIDHKNDQYFIQLTFDANGEGILFDKTDGTSAQLILRRSVKDTQASYRTFGDFTKDEYDCSYDISTEPSYVYIRVYVLAYGLDNSFKAVYSRPTLLTNGAVQLTRQGVN